MLNYFVLKVLEQSCNAKLFFGLFYLKMSFVINTTVDKNQELLDAYKESFENDEDKDVFLISNRMRIGLHSYALGKLLLGFLMFRDSHSLDSDVYNTSAEVLISEDRIFLAYNIDFYKLSYKISSVVLVLALSSDFFCTILSENHRDTINIIIPGQSSIFLRILSRN